MRLTLLALVAVLLVACGEEPTATPPPDESTGAETFEGALGGNAELEGGCAWLDTDDGRVEVLYPQGYTVDLDPVRLVGPDGDTLAEEGDTVRIRGQLVEDRVSVCQVGPIVEATEVVS